MNWLVLFVLVYCLLATVEAGNQIVKCSDSYTNGMFKWKYGKEVFTAAQPICWEKEKHFPVLRQCNTLTGKWQPAQVTCSDEKPKNIYCPEDLTEIRASGRKPLCIKLSTKPHKYNASYCYGADSYMLDLPRQDRVQLLTYLYERGVQRMWLPLQRVNENRFSQFSIRLPGKLWGEVASSVNLQNEDLLSDRHCLALSIDRNANYVIKMTHCADSAHTVCVFKKALVATSGCPQGFGALSYRPTECYGVNWESGIFPADQRELPIAEYYAKRNTLRLILKKFEPISKFFEVGRFRDVDGINYELLMHDDEALQVRPVNEQKQHALCAELVTERRKVEMLLKLDGDLNELVAVVYNRHYIWKVGDIEDDFGIKCYSNADYEEWSTVKIEMIWENDDQTKSIFKLKLLGDGPGEYWCEAHTIFDFELIATERLVASKKRRGHPFTLRYDVHCKDQRKNLCQNVPQNMKKLSRGIRDSLKDCKNADEQRKFLRNLVIHDARVMAIEDYTENSLRCLVHVTVSHSGSAIDNSEQQSSQEDDSEESSEGVRHDTSVRMELRNLLVTLMAQCQPLLANSVRSAEFCFPEIFKTQNGAENQWLLALRGQAATTLKLCLKPNGLPNTRMCLGGFLEGAYWASTAQQINCATGPDWTDVTATLYALDKSKVSRTSPAKAVHKVKSVLAEHLRQLIPADLYYMAKVLRSSMQSIESRAELYNAFANATNASTHAHTPPRPPPPPQNASSGMPPPALAVNAAMRDIVRIYNYLMDVNETTMRSSIALNSTNILLAVFEQIIDKTAMSDYQETTADDTLDSDLNFTEYTDIGVTVKAAKNFVIFSIDPMVASVSGVAIFRNATADEPAALSGAFAGEYYRFLEVDHTIDRLLSVPDIELATYVPSSLLQRLGEIAAAANYTLTTKPIIVIKVYASDRLFQEAADAEIQAIVAGRVISISIPGYNSDLPEWLPLVLRVASQDIHIHDAEHNHTDEHSCSYWNYKTWANDGLTFLGRSDIDHDVIVCGCTHLTPFAYLLAGNSNHSVESEIEVIVRETHKKALDIITLVGCSLSLFGIAGVFITAATFQSWRQKASSKVLLQLSAAIALQMILFCFVNTEEYSMHLIQNDIVSSCVAIGALLHYSVLVQFCWMNVIAYLQFKRYVQVFGNARPKRFFIKAAVFAWGLPLLPVLAVAIIEKDSFSEDMLCYPSGHALYFGVALPVALIIVANFSIFLIVIYSILRGPDGSIRHTEKRIIISQIRLSILLFFLLGFTWIFGLLTAMRMGIVFSYLFSLTATLQGFVIFVYFIILDPVTRRMWCGYIRRTFGIGKTTFESASSVKETTQSF